MVPVRRHARHWRTYLAAGGLVLVLACTNAVAAQTQSGLPPPIPYSQNSGTEHQSVTQGPQAKAEEDKRAVSPGNLGKAAPNQKAGSGEHYETATETPEKIFGKSPDWWVAVCTAALCAATIVLGVFTFFLWKVTQRAVRDTGKGLEIAQRQADLTEKALIASTRPYFVVNVVAFIGRKPDGPLAMSRMLKVYYLNYGNSPAVVRRSVHDVLVKKEPITKVDIECLQTKPHYYVVEASAKTGEISVTAKTAEDLTSSKVSTDGAFVYAVGRMLYEGAPGIEHETSFCWRYYSEHNEFRQDDDHPELNRRT